MLKAIEYCDVIAVLGRLKQSLEEKDTMRACTKTKALATAAAVQAVSRAVIS